ncbi:MAG: BREX system Lon protease-like protein BrxL [Candidatus Pacearchaeota archaeon]
MVVNQDELNAKLKYYYPEYIVNKRIVNIQDIRQVPKFVSEYLLTKVIGEREEKIGEKISKIVELITNFYPEAKDRDKILDKIIVKKQSHKIIDEIKVEIDEKHEIRKAIIPSLNIRNAMILDSIVDKNPELLSSGIWGLASLRFSNPIIDESGRKLTSSILIDKFEPFHIVNINTNEFIEKRKYFTTEEWIDVLINTIGLNPEVYNERQKLILISRFIPLVENNINLLELGPRATGKTYFYRNISFYTRIISGGLITPAQLFFNIAKKMMGEIGIKDCIVFDEIAKIRFGNVDEMMGKLKDYMESAHFERGPKKATSLCSLVFMGNLDIKPTDSGYIPVEDINYSLPDFMRSDTAFLDRINALIPGWEIIKIKKTDIHLSKNFGFSVDFFSEILHDLRKRDFTSFLRDRVDLENVTIRDEKSIFRVASGLTKVLFPDRRIDNKSLKIIMDIAVEYRQKIADLLHKMAPGEFEKKKIEYRIKKI